MVDARVQVLSVEHADVLDEIEQLRGQLRGFESAVVSGQQTPSAVKVGHVLASTGPAFGNHSELAVVLNVTDCNSPYCL